MRSLMLEIAAATAITLGAILASVQNAGAAEIAVTGAFARASATPQAKSGAAYVTITNHGSVEDQLQSLKTSAAATAMVHETKEENGAISMSPVAAVKIPAGASIEMRPGGLHIMLMALKSPLKEGETLHLDLTFAKAGSVGVDVPIKGIAAMAP